MMNENLMKLDELADELLEKSLKKAEEDVEPKESNGKDLKAEDVIEDETSNSKEDEKELEEDKKSEPKDEEKSEPKEDEKDLEKDEKPDSKDEEKELDEDETSNSKDEEKELEEEEKSEPKDEEKELEKSTETEAIEESVVEKSVNNSRAFADAIEVLHKSITDIGSANNTTDGILAKSLISLINANNSLKEENHTLNERLDSIEKSMGEKFDTLLDAVESMANQPANMRKSMKNVHVHDRDFAKSLNGNVNKFDSLSKSEVLGILNDELYNNNPSVTVSDVIGFESGAPLRPELKALVENKVK